LNGVTPEYGPVGWLSTFASNYCSLANAGPACHVRRSSTGLARRLLYLSGRPVLRRPSL